MVNDSCGGEDLKHFQVLAVLLCKYLYFHFSPRSQSPKKIRQNIQGLINLKPAFAVRKLLTDKNLPMKLRTTTIMS